MAGLDDAEPAAGTTRRQLLGRMAVATGVAWTAPQILSMEAASAATPTPGLTAGWAAQHSIAGSCSGITASYQPYTPNSSATSWSPLPRSCGSLLVRTLYGLGSNGTGTIIAVGDQSFRVRWTSSGGTMSQDSQGLPGSFGVYRDIAASGTAWVAVGDSGAIARSTDDGVTFSGTTSQPAGAPGLSFVATSGSGTWLAGGGTIGLLWRSTDGGATWSDVSIGSTSAIFQGATYVASASRWLAAGTLGEIWQSDDDGVTWALNIDTGSDSWAGIAARGSTVVAVAAGLGRIARSTNAAGSWTTTTIGGGTPAFTNVAAGPDQEWMAVGLANQVLWSDDDGASWSAASGLPSLRTWEDVVHADVAG